MRLPGWIVDNTESVRREAEPYRTMDPGERIKHLVLACQSAAALLASRPDRQRVLDYVDPLPASTRLALKRLRRRG